MKKIVLLLTTLITIGVFSQTRSDGDASNTVKVTFNLNGVTDTTLVYYPPRAVSSPEGYICKFAVEYTDATANDDTLGIGGLTVQDFTDHPKVPTIYESFILDSAATGVVREIDGVKIIKKEWQWNNWPFRYCAFKYDKNTGESTDINIILTWTFLRPR